MTKQEVKAMIEDADCNGDNKLDYHEVSAIIAKVFDLGVNVLRRLCCFLQHITGVVCLFVVFSVKNQFFF